MGAAIASSNDEMQILVVCGEVDSMWKK